MCFTFYYKLQIYEKNENRHSKVEIFFSHFPIYYVSLQNTIYRKMNHKILKCSLMLAALALVACTDKEFTVDTGESPDSSSQPARPLTAEVETISVPNSSVTFDVVLVKAGSFIMGGVDPEGLAHQVSLTHDFYIGRTEVTQALYYAVMKENPSHFNDGDNFPVDNISHWDAVQFCQKLSQITGYHFVLPTEAQWEYAAQGGHKAPAAHTDYSGGNYIDNVGWYWGNAPHYNVNAVSSITGHDTVLVARRTSAVKGKQPNALGLYDMTGNVREWCADWYSPLGSEAVTDPTGPLSSDRGRVYRGGSCNDSAQYCRVAHRESLSTMSKGFDFGFRIAINMD